MVLTVEPPPWWVCIGLGYIVSVPSLVFAHFLTRPAFRNPDPGSHNRQPPPPPPTCASVPHFCVVLQALPDDETVFFERTPLAEWAVTHLAAFGETSPTHERMIGEMIRNGYIVRVSSYERSTVR